jgi:ATP-dependent helicase HrpA
LIVTSATLDPERLAQHFGGAPILQVEGRTYPVEIRYQAPDEDHDLEEQVAAGIEGLWRGGKVGDALPSRPLAGDVLVFLPGEREINELARSLPGRFPRAEVLPLYSRLPAEKQDRVFSTRGAPRIVLATNVAETSVTVPGIRYVVDTGTARINRYSPRLGVQQLQIEPVSQAAAQQRAGRCGRVGPGVALRLYEEDDFAARAPFTTSAFTSARALPVSYPRKCVSPSSVAIALCRSPTPASPEPFHSERARCSAMWRSKPGSATESPRSAAMVRVRSMGKPKVS